MPVRHYLYVWAKARIMRSAFTPTFMSGYQLPKPNRALAQHTRSAHPRKISHKKRAASFQSSSSVFYCNTFISSILSGTHSHLHFQAVKLLRSLCRLFLFLSYRVRAMRGGSMLPDHSGGARSPGRSRRSQKFVC